MESYTFADLVGDEELFFAEYWDKKPMLRKNALRGNPSEILSVARLDEMVNMEVIRPPYVRVNLNGNGIPEKAFTQTVTVQGTEIPDSVIPERLYDLYRSGATIVWSSLNHIEPRLRSFCGLISDKLGARTDCVAFLTPAGHQGFNPHHDPVDLFIVQTEGTKHWRLWNPQGERSSQIGTYTEEQLGEPAIDVLMEPGDVLYLPYHTPHAAAARDRTSVHLSIMMRPRKWEELLHKTVESLTEGPEFAAFPYIGDSRGASVEEEFKVKLAALAAKLGSLDAPTELDRLLDSGRRLEPGRPPRHRPEDTFAHSASLDVLGPEAKLRRTGIPLEFGASDNGRTQLVCKGRTIAVPSAVAEVLAGLEEGASVDAATLFPDLPVERSVKNAQGFARLGVLEVAA